MTARIDEPMVIGGVAVRNRLYRAPVLEGAGRAKDPAGEYAKHFVPNAKAGVGLIVQGNTIVLPEGRTSPGMSGITGREQVLALAPMVRQVHEAGARIAVQLGHGGAYSLESWHREFVAARTHLPFAPGRLPFPQRWFHGGVHVMTTGEVEALAARFGVVAAWAREAGYDAVQLAGSNAKLLHLFLSRRYNRRDDKYGGSLENRFRLIAEIRAAIAREAGEDFPVWLKFPACEGRGISRTEGITIARLAEDAGFSALTPVIADALPTTAICRGDFPWASFKNANLSRMFAEATGSRYRFHVMRAAMWYGARRHPFSPTWNRGVFAPVKRAVRVPVFGVGGIRTREEADSILGAGDADMIGIGRPFYAEADLPAHFLAGDGAPTACESSNHCVVPQMLGLPGVCYNPKVKKAAARARG